MKTYIKISFTLAIASCLSGCGIPMFGPADGAYINNNVYAANAAMARNDIQDKQTQIHTARMNMQTVPLPPSGDPTIDAENQRMRAINNNQAYQQIRQAHHDIRNDYRTIYGPSY